MRTRSFRRHQRARLLARALFIIHKWRSLPDADRSETSLVGAAKLVDNRTPCSCSMCGNPRRSPMRWESRLTRAELRALGDLAEARIYECGASL